LLPGDGNSKSSAPKYAKSVIASDDLNNTFIRGAIEVIGGAGVHAGEIRQVGRNIVDGCVQRGTRGPEQHGQRQEDVGDAHGIQKQFSDAYGSKMAADLVRD
jgi:hypothetical protein